MGEPAERRDDTADEIEEMLKGVEYDVDPRSGMFKRVGFGWADMLDMISDEIFPQKESFREVMMQLTRLRIGGIEMQIDQIVESVLVKHARKHAVALLEELPDSWMFSLLNTMQHMGRDELIFSRHEADWSKLAGIAVDETPTHPSKLRNNAVALAEEDIRLDLARRARTVLDDEPDPMERLDEEAPAGKIDPFEEAKRQAEEAIEEAEAIVKAREGDGKKTYGDPLVDSLLLKEDDEADKITGIEEMKKKHPKVWEDLVSFGLTEKEEDDDDGE